MRCINVLISAGLAIAVLASIAMTGRAGAAEDEYAGLPDAPGREEVATYCVACHSLKIVVQQGLTRSDWSELLTWMYEEQEMPELEPDEKKLVLDYLAKFVGPDTQKKRLKQRGLLR